MLGVVVISPWRNSSSEPEVLRLLLFLVIASGVLALASLWTTPRRERKVNSYHSPILLSIPMALGIMLCALQAKPLPDDWLKILSPKVPELRQVLLPDTASGVNLDSIYGEDGGAARRELAATLADDVAPTVDFLNETIQYDDEDVRFDARRALALDAAAERQFLVPSYRFGMREWGRMISVYPLATRQTTTLFWAAIVLFLAAAVLFNTADSRRVLLKTVVFVALAFALLALAGRANYEVILRAKSTFNFWWLDDSRMNYGTFANKNAAAGYLVLAFGASVYFMAREFLLTIRLKKKDLENRKLVELEDEKEEVYKVQKESKWTVLVGDFIDLFNRKLLFWLFALSVLYAAIFASMSRGGAIAATVALFVALVALLSRKDARRFWFVPCVAFLFVAGALVAMNLHKSVDERMSTLVAEDENGEFEITKESRLSNWASAIETAKDYKWLGSGLGSYFVVGARNDRMMARDSLYYYAENTFVQTLVEMGVVGLVLLIAAYAMLIVCFVRKLSGKRSIETIALGVAATSMVAGQIVSSCMDFGIYFPGALFLFFILSGAFVSRQNRRKWDAVKNRMINSRQSVEAAREIRYLEKREEMGMITFSLILLLVLAGSKWMLLENKDHVTRTNLLRSADELLEQEPTYLSVGSFNEDIAKIKKYALKRNDSCELQQALAKLCIQRYRIGYFNYLKERSPEEKDEELWRQSDIEVFLDVLLGYQSIGFDTATAALRDSSELRNNFVAVLASLYAARRICPLQTRVWQPIPAYVPLVYKMTWEDERQVELLYALRGASTTPYDTKLLLRYGRHLGVFRLYRAQSLFLKRAVQYQPTYAPYALLILESSTPPNQLGKRASEVLPDSMYGLFYAAYNLRKWRVASMTDVVREKFDSVYADAPEESRNYDFYYYAGMYLKDSGRYSEAIDAFAKAEEFGNDDDKAFFAKMNVFVSHGRELQRYYECVELLRAYCDSPGAKVWKAEKLLEKAEEQMRRAEAREKARERIRHENEQDERVRRSVDEGERGVDDESASSDYDVDASDESVDAEDSDDDISKSIDEIEKILLD